MASNSERIMEKSRHFQIIYAGRTILSKQTKRPCERHYETRDSPTTTLSQWGKASSRKQSEYGRHGLSNILKLQATFLNSTYHQRAGKTNLFHMRGGRFHAGNTSCTFKLYLLLRYYPSPPFFENTITSDGSVKRLLMILVGGEYYLWFTPKSW